MLLGRTHSFWPFYFHLDVVIGTVNVLPHYLEMLWCYVKRGGPIISGYRFFPYLAPLFLLVHILYTPFHLLSCKVKFVFYGISFNILFCFQIHRGNIIADVVKGVDILVKVVKTVLFSYVKTSIRFGDECILHDERD